MGSQLIKKQTEDAIGNIQTSWQKTVLSVLQTAQMLHDYSSRSDWSDIQRQLSDRGIMSTQVISMMMGIARNPQLNDPKNIDLLPPAYNTLYNLSKLDEDEFRDHIKIGDISPSLRLEDVRKWRNTSVKKKKSPRSQSITISIPSNELKHCKNDVVNAIDRLSKKFPYLKVRKSW